ncbi:MAG: glycosyltransferase involved in cell wall biosynthesis [Pseudohongiellaceae bacterium]|jgi:glycosyltransferase involved in cell wall biosynthesis
MEAAISEGFKVTVITTVTDDSYRNKIESSGAECINFVISRVSINPVSFFIDFVRAMRIFAFLKPAMVHCITIKPNILGGVVSRIYQIPCVLSITGTGVLFTKHGCRSWGLRQLITRAYKFSAVGEKAIIFENVDDKKTFSKLKIGVDNAHYLVRGAGINTELFKPVGTYSKTDNVDIKILFAARLLKDKGLDSLVDACRVLRGESYTIDLCVAGIIDPDVKDAIPISEIKSLHLTGDINWLGTIENMPHLLNKVDVVVLPTRYGEGVPRILIEAAACGKPCITTDVPGCRDIVVHEQTGLLVPVNDSVKLVEAIKKMLDVRFCEQLGRNARARVLNEFSDITVIKETMHIYQALI